MERDLYKTIGQRIRRAREQSGMSQEELARHMDYKSPATVSHFENGNRKVSVEDLRALAELFGLPLEGLIGLTNEELTPETQQVLLRANVVMPTARKVVEEFLVFTQKHAKTPCDLPLGLAEDRPGKAAEQILNLTRCDTLPISPWMVAEGLNVPVVDWDFPDDISGVFVINDGKVCIGINRDHPVVRRAFTVAHELGHFIFHRNSTVLIDFTQTEIAATDDDKTRQRETKANQFAADLLMPKSWIERDYRSPDQLPHLARRYGVREQTLWYRLVSLKLV